MNMCRNGHDRDVVGTQTRMDKGKPVTRCAQCVADYRARELATRKAKRAAAKPRKPRQTPEERRARRTARARELRRERGVQPREQHADGYEDEYGPIPPSVRNQDWFDWVVVARMLQGIPVGRWPTKLEWAEFYARNKTTTFDEVRHAANVSSATVSGRARENGYSWPYELTSHARSRKE